MANIVSQNLTTGLTAAGSLSIQRVDKKTYVVEIASSFNIGTGTWSRIKPRSRST